MPRSEKSKQQRREYAAAYKLKNPDAEKRRALRWRQRNKTKISETHLLRKYGMTLQQKQAMLEGQHGKCAICGTADPGNRTRATADVNRWHVDHDHSTGSVRGILCGDCNAGLGGFKDNVVALRNAVVYLEAAECRQAT